MSEINLDDLHIGSIYRWVPTDPRCWVPWFEANDLKISASRPGADTILMYLGTHIYHSNVVAAHIFLAREKKYAVWNTDFIYGLRPIKA
jgi:hypothetical protein